MAVRASEDATQDRLRRHRYGELVEAIVEDPSLVTRSMFGALACYLHGRLALVLADGDPPWDGLLVATAREHHAALRDTVPSLRVHPVLGKWLYLPAMDDGFETDARRLAELAAAGDLRIGVEPSARRARAGAPRGARRVRRRR